jgi:hypothetical protein
LRGALDQGVVVATGRLWNARPVTRTRSPLETAIVAWIALKIVSLLLGFGVTVETLSSRSGAARLNPEVGKALGYISLALIAVIVMILVIEAKYLIAACVVAIAVAFPLLVQTRGVPITAARPVPRHGASPAPTGLAPTPNVRDVPARAAAIPLEDFYTALLADSRLSQRSAIIVQGSSACMHMTARARARLERAFLGSAGGANACQLALGVAAHHHAFGEPQLSLRALRHGVFVPPGARTALFAGGRDVDVQVVASHGHAWKMGGFSGPGFPSRG